MSKSEPGTDRVPHLINRASSRTHSSVDDKFYLGIDGGASKTHAVITDASSNLLGEGHSGPSNPARVGVDEAIANIHQAVSDACLQAGLEPDQLSSICAALAGVGDHAHYVPMKNALDREFGSDRVELVTDARAALEGALDGEPGIVVIAGTGSIAMGVDDRGEQARSGGWGPIIGDEGSAYDIARQALKAVAATFDGRAPETLLTELICTRLGIDSAADLPAAIYNGEYEHAEIASLAELVYEALQRGDATSKSILEQAGKSLGDLAVSVIRRLGMNRERFQVACVGSVFHSGNVVIKPLRDAVLGAAPLAEVGPPLFSPAMGAARLAKRLEASLLSHR